MSSEKQHDEFSTTLDFLSPRLRELLKRLAKRDRREPLQQLAWYIEEDANGRLKYYRDETATPRIPLDGLPEVHYPQKLEVRRVPRQVGDTVARPEDE